MYRHAPPTANQRWARCGICNNSKCIISKFIEPCNCVGALGVVHEECLKQTISTRGQAQPNGDGYCCHMCQKCGGQIFYRPNFTAGFVSCGDMSGWEHCGLIIMVVVLSAFCAGIAIGMSKVQEVYMIAFGCAFIVLAFPVIIYNIYRLCTARFWKLKNPNASFDKMAAQS